MHRGYTAERYLETLAAARAAIPDLAVTTDIIVGFPGETDDDFAATLEVVAEAEYDFAYTFIFSPRPGTEAAAHDRPVRRPGRRAASASNGCGSSSSAARWPGTGPASAGSRSVLVEGPSKKDPAVTSGPHPPEQARALPARPAAAAGHLRDGRDHRRRARTTCSGRLVEVTADASHRTRIPVAWPARDEPPPGDADLAGGVRRSPSSGRRRRASRPSPWPRPGRRGTELVAVDAMQVYRGMDIGTAKPTPPSGPRSAHHGIDLADPARTSPSSAFQAACDAASAEIAARGRRAVLVGGTGLYLRVVIDGLDPPGAWPEIRAELEAGARHRRALRPPPPLDPVAAAEMEPSNRRRVVRALEVCLGSGRPFSRSAPGSPPTHRATWSRSACAGPGRRSPSGSMDRLNLDITSHVIVHAPNPDRPVTSPDLVAIATGGN